MIHTIHTSYGDMDIPIPCDCNGDDKSYPIKIYQIRLYSTWKKRFFHVRQRDDRIRHRISHERYLRFQDF